MPDDVIIERNKVVEDFVRDKSGDVVNNGLVNTQTTEDYSKNLFNLPFPESKLEGFGTNISPAHQGNLVNSIDFFIPFGTELYAAAAGKVVKVKSDSNVGGMDIKYWAQGNYIEIEHKHEEYTWYEHLKFEGVVVKIGQNVTAGQLIGYSGSTGFSHMPHLHFQVNRYFGSGENDYVTLRAKFIGFKDLYKIDKADTKKLNIRNLKDLKQNDSTV
jgi:murein DD-endopeptidase MepM/ murein hydrolase activator NlpD